MRLVSSVATTLLLLGAGTILFGTVSKDSGTLIAGVVLFLSGWLMNRGYRDAKLYRELEEAREIQLRLDQIEFEEAPTPPDTDGHRYSRRGDRTTSPHTVIPLGIRPTRDASDGVPMPMRESGSHPVAPDTDEYLQVDDV